MAIELPHTTVEMVGAFLLVLMRMTGIMIAAPLFSNTAFPVQLRIWLSFFLALVMFPIAWNLTPAGVVLASLEHPFVSLLTVAGEITLGWIIGWTASVLIWSVQLAGHLVGQELGMSIGEVFDPISETQSGIVPQLFLTFALVCFVLLGGHHLVVTSLARSFEVAPLGHFPVGATTADYLATDLGNELWRQGVRLALPVIVALLLVTVAMGILARTVPEMNVFIIGFALRIVFGLLAVVVVLPFVAEALRAFLDSTQGFIDSLFQLWGGG